MHTYICARIQSKSHDNPFLLPTYLQARTHPSKLQELRELFYLEVARYNVFPIDNRRRERLLDDDDKKPSMVQGRTKMTFYQGR